MEERTSWIRRVDRTGVPLLAARLVLGAVFLSMGWSKFQDPYNFLKQVRLYEMLPESPPYWLNAVATLLPTLEIICGVALILGVLLRGAGLNILAMLMVFTPAILFRALAVRAESGQSFFEIAFDCGCGGGPQIIWQKLLENSGLIVLALVPVLSRSRRFTLARWLAHRKNPSPALISSPTGCAAEAAAVADADEPACSHASTSPTMSE